MPEPAEPSLPFVHSAAARVAADRALTLERIAALDQNFEAIVAAARDTATDDEHDPEGQTIAFERSQVQALLEQAHAHLDRLDEATERLTSGEYRTCVRCGQPIGDERLAARPTAATCIRCATLNSR